MQGGPGRGLGHQQGLSEWKCGQKDVRMQGGWGNASQCVSAQDKQVTGSLDASIHGGLVQGTGE